MIGMEYRDVISKNMLGKSSHIYHLKEKYREFLLGWNNVLIYRLEDQTSWKFTRVSDPRPRALLCKIQCYYLYNKT